MEQDQSNNQEPSDRAEEPELATASCSEGGSEDERKKEDARIRKVRPGEGHAAYIYRVRSEIATLRLLRPLIPIPNSDLTSEGEKSK